ncbi:hypothetical protein PQQ96_21955 [Paraburkholderia sediminicola]|uniref:hypothetical protein n=1 Tax=Paraburkholderia sediminicola TaxID=458836 RepID=UPI0038B6FB2E
MTARASRAIAPCIPILNLLQHGIDEMAFKSVDSILQPDPRFADLCIVKNGLIRPVSLADHHSALAGITLTDLMPDEVQVAFDRARNTIIYALEGLNNPFSALDL